MNRSIEVKQVLYMTAGEGEKSYTQNSSIQNKAQATAKIAVQQAILDLYLSRVGKSSSSSSNNYNNKCVLRIADLGCSFGPNAWKVATDVVDTVVKKCHELKSCLPEFQIFLNDLPGNDFNTVFRSIPEIFLHKRLRCYVAGVPGSFYDKLFPDKSIDFFHTSSSINWLSQVPLELQGEDGARLNNDKIFISHSSPQVVIDAYRMQFQRDLEKFLHSRSEEMVANGRMVLMCMARRGVDASSAEEYRILWDLLAQALNDMAAEGIVEKEKIITFNTPCYSPSAKEVMDVVERDGSFSVKFKDFFKVDMVGNRKEKTTNNGFDENNSRARNIARHTRGVLQSLMATIVGEDLIDDLFVRYEKILHEYSLLDKVLMGNLIVVLEREP